jgi:hypothetical protein
VSLEKRITELTAAIDRIVVVIEKVAPPFSTNATFDTGAPKSSISSIVQKESEAPQGVSSLFGGGTATGAATPVSAEPAIRPASYEQIFNFVVRCAEKIKNEKGDAGVVEFANKTKKEIYPHYKNSEGNPISSIEELQAVSDEIRGMVMNDLVKLGEEYGC